MRQQSEREVETVSPAASVLVQVGTHFFHQQNLFAFATQAEVLQYVRRRSARNTRASRRFFQPGKTVQPRVADLIRREAGLADAIRLADIPKQYQPKLDSLLSDNLFRKTFFVCPGELLFGRN